MVAIRPSRSQFRCCSNRFLAGFWSVADLLRGDFKQSEYGRVILPLVVLRRLDCVLAETKPAVVERAEQLEGRVDNPDAALKAAAGHEFHNTSRFDFAELTGDPSNIARNLRAFIGGFSRGAGEVIDKFRFDDQIVRLDDADLLYQVVAKFADLDLHPDQVGNHEMGYIYEELIRRFSEQSNETAGEHFTPREVIRLMVDLLFAEDDEALRKPGVVRTLFDPACGTGGMLAVAEERLLGMNPDADLAVYGQELNDESYAMCRSDMMLKEQGSENIKSGNSFSNDEFKGQRFDYLLANPPFGVEWKKVHKAVKDEAKRLGFQGRFGAGLPRINDGSLLLLQHMISKMKTPEEGGSRLAIVFNESLRFDIHWDRNPHLTFGTGTHVCLGANLTKEMRLVIDGLLDCVRSLEPSGPVERIRSDKDTGFRHAPVRFIPTS